jgi:AcrR family transcriptional regulator
VSALAAAADPRARIHAAALQLFARYGYEAVSLQRIADEVGLHKSSLFHHYKSKLELALEVLAEALEEVLRLLQPLAGSTGLDGLLACTDALVDLLSDRPEAARLMMSFLLAPAGSELRVPLRSPCADLERDLFALLMGWLARARRAGAIRVRSVRQATFNLIGLVLFYPAIAPDYATVAGPEPFSPSARRVRKHELAATIRGMLGRPDGNT